MVLNLACKSSIMIYLLQSCLEQIHLDWLPSIKAGSSDAKQL